MLYNHPERFSPNVALRPVYQESILPNIAYVGGGGEIAHRLERKSQFEAFGVFYPVLIRRNSLIMVTKAMRKSMDKLQVTIADLLQSEEHLITSYLEKISDTVFHLKEEEADLQAIFTVIAHKARSIDPTLEAVVVGEAHKISKAIENIENKLKKSLKQKEDIHISQLKTLRNKLFPNNGLQERVESFLQYYAMEDEGFVDALIEICDPMNKNFLFVHLD